MEWMKTTMEKPRYIEEMSAEPGAGETAREGVVPVPAALYEPLGINETSGLRIWMARQTPEFLAQPMLPLTTTLEMSLDQLGLEGDASEMSVDAAKAYVRAQQRPLIIVQRDGTIRAFRPFKGKFERILVIVDTGAGPGLLITGDSTKSQIQISQLSAPLLAAYETAEVVIRAAAAEPTGEEPAAAAVPTLRIKRTAAPLTAIPESSRSDDLADRRVRTLALTGPPAPEEATADLEGTAPVAPVPVAQPPPIPVAQEAISRTMGVPRPEATQTLRVKRKKTATAAAPKV